MNNPLPETVPTPFVLVDEQTLRNNIRRIHAYADRHGLAVRPHIKTHKSLRMARMQMEAGAVGIAVAKVGEAEVMARLGDADMTVAYPAVGTERAGRIARLARNRSVRVAADCEFHMEILAAAAETHGTEIGIHIMFDAGLHRCGVSDPAQMVRLARYARNRAGLRYDGVQMYLGHLYGPAAEAPESFERINRLWEPVYERLCDAGLQPEMVSSGSTPSLFNTHRVRHISEIRVGTALLNDYFILKFGHCTQDACAARLVATVVSDAVPGQVIIDAGAKALSAKQLLRHEQLELGYIPEHPEARIFRLHEEHGWVDVSRCPERPRVGDRLGIVPVNVALCMNLHDTWYLLSTTGDPETEKVDARGCVV
ncbi:alanine racemase [Desulfonema ishimotonii]|uniref:Alanine racemase n=1 Tax=Desulfonema ishimotonii TaxID=45657 RepID=A0A401FYG9_9BACT|nr:alanine racemase [Desulfonema ishimotonii]GBC62007.1 alanine racemase [Desulfonema ishimotonii]